MIVYNEKNMHKITRTCRNQAIAALDLAASNYDAFLAEAESGPGLTLIGVILGLAQTAAARSLMRAAWSSVPEVDAAVSLGSAAALLRDGWSPGKPVVVYEQASGFYPGKYDDVRRRIAQENAGRRTLRTRWLRTNVMLPPTATETAAWLRRRGVVCVVAPQVP